MHTTKPTKVNLKNNKKTNPDTWMLFLPFVLRHERKFLILKKGLKGSRFTDFVLTFPPIGQGLKERGDIKKINPSNVLSLKKAHEKLL